MGNLFCGEDSAADDNTLRKEKPKPEPEPEIIWKNIIGPYFEPEFFAQEFASFIHPEDWKFLLESGLYEINKKNSFHVRYTMDGNENSDGRAIFYCT
jgi:hypothetical protein